MMLKKLWKEAGVCQPAATQNDVIVHDPTQSLIVKIVPTWYSFLILLFDFVVVFSHMEPLKTRIFLLSVFQCFK